MRNAVLLLMCMIFAVGCGPQRRLQYLPDQQQPPPRADLPVDLRLENYIGTEDTGREGGSCAHVSTRHCFRAAGDWELDREWASTPGHEGPEYGDRLLEKLDRKDVIFAATEDGDIEVLEAASRSGRWATIFYYPSHSITFCGFETIGGDEVALLLDNNFPDYYIVVPRKLFEHSWKNVYGGFAVAPWRSRVVPRTYSRTREIDYANGQNYAASY
jgi:hypothetical protein